MATMLSKNLLVVCFFILWLSVSYKRKKKNFLALISLVKISIRYKSRRYKDTPRLRPKTKIFNIYITFISIIIKTCKTYKNILEIVKLINLINRIK